MATSGMNNQSAGQSPADVEEYQNKWRELAEALEAQQKAADLLDTQKAELPSLEAAMAPHRKNAFDKIKNFAPEGPLRNKVSSAAPNGSGAPIDLLVKQAGIKDSYFTEDINGQRADAFRITQIGSVKELTRSAYEPSGLDPVRYPKMGAVDDLNNDPLIKADAFIAGRMELRQEAEIAAAAKNGPVQDTQTAHKVETQLFQYRREDEKSRQVVMRNSPQQSDAGFKSMAAAGPELQDKLLEKPAEEVLGFAGKTNTNKKMTDEQKASYSPAFFSSSRFNGSKSDEVMKAIAPYAQAMADKNAKLGAIAATQAELTNQTGKAAASLRSMSAGFKYSRGSEKGIPFFDLEHFEHFTKLNPGNPEDRVKLAEAARMQMGATPAQLSEAMKRLADTARAPRVAENSPQASGVDDKATAAAQPEQARAAKPELVRGSSMPRPSSPEERQRRVEQAEFFASRGLTSRTSEAEMVKAEEDFAHQREQRAADQRRAAQPLEASRPAVPRAPANQSGMTR